MTVTPSWQPMAQTETNPPAASADIWEDIARYLADYVIKSATTYYGRSQEYVLDDVCLKLWQLKK